MGGKTKQSQRTKNNVRPSSSGRSAELLNNASRLDPGLMSTSGGKVLPVLFPTLAAALDPSLNPDFAMCLKKLNKKDPITKTKALQELSELVKKADVDDVVAALPSWAHSYRALVTDTDHKVREAAQTTHGVIVGACGRRIAPQLKALLPPWLQAQYDEYAPAAAAARASLQSTFPENKLPDVISFCMAEVIAHLLENLVGNAAETTLSKKILTPEEKELQCARLVTASLQGLEFFAQHLPAQHDAWLWAQLAPVLQAASFWKMAEHKSQQVRASWYGALGRVIARYGDTFGAAHGRRTARLLLAAPAPTAPLWACLLVLMRHVQADTWLEKKDLLIKRIIDLLENGGWGDAKHLSGMLLPLLAYLPTHLLTEDFYTSFFNAIFKGLEKKSVISSKSERQAWVTGLSECLRYLTLQPAAFVPHVAAAAHRAWLRAALRLHRDAPTATSLIKHSAAAMASLVKRWLERPGDQHDRLVRNFWQNVAATAQAQIDSVPPADRNDVVAHVESHTLLLQTLRCSFETRKARSIRFDDERRAVEESAEAPRECDAAVLERYDHNLEEVAAKICVQYFEFASKNLAADVVLCPLLTLLVEFDGKNLFMALARHFGADSIYGFYDKVLRAWLAGDAMRCRAVVDVVFLLLKHLSEEEQDALLDSFKQFPPAVVEWGMSLGLSHPHCGLGAVRRWLRGPQVDAGVLRACRRMLAEDCGRSRGLLLMCLSADRDGEMMISPASVSKIVELVAAALSPAAPRLERLAEVAAALASELAGARDCTELALALFRLQLDIQRGSALLPVETWCEVRGAWQDAGAASEAFQARAVEAARRKVTEDAENLDIQKIEHVASLCPYLLAEFGEARVPGAAAAAGLLRQLFDFQHDSHTPLEVFALQHDVVHSTLNCPLEDTAHIRAVVALSSLTGQLTLTPASLTGQLTRLVFRTALLRELMLHRDEDERAWADDLLQDEYIEEQFAGVLHDYAVVCSLHDGYAFWEHYSVIERAKRHVATTLDAVTSAGAAAARRGLRGLARRASAQGYYWSRAVLLLRGKGAPSEDHTPASADGLKLEEIVTGNGFFHTLQCESKSSSNRLAPLRAAYMVMLRSFYLAHAHEPDVIDATFIAEAAAGAATDPAVIVNAYYRHQHTMLYDSDIYAAEWRQVVSNACVVEYLTEMVETGGWDAAAASWDFATISLCSLAAALHKARAHWGCPKVAMLACSVLKLFSAVKRFVGGVKAKCLQREPAPHVAELPTEWRDIFAPDLHYNLFSIVASVLGDADASPTAPQAAVLDALLPVTRDLDWHALPLQHQSGELSVAKLLGAGACALGEPVHHGYKYLAHALLAALAKPLVIHDAEKLAAWSGDDGGDEESPRVQLALGGLLPPLARLQELVDAALHTFRVGEETCEMLPASDSHSLALGYLLLADAHYATCQLARGDLVHHYIELCRVGEETCVLPSSDSHSLALGYLLLADAHYATCQLARGDLVPHYIELCREKKHSELLVTAALRLLPAPVAAHAQDAAGAPPPAHYLPMFLDRPEPKLTDPSTSLDIGRLACRALWHAARWAGGATRGWWGAAPPRAARALERLLRAYVSPTLVREQLQAVASLEDAEVLVHWSTNEVVCRHHVEERPMELVVTLGAAHPLPLPRVAAQGAPQHTTQWLAVYLAYQNGTVLNALRMWMDTVARRVEASPQCYICYCRLHPASGRLPKVVCHQCRNKFHAECLRKWFTTSSKSNCPLCRANF